MYWRPVGSMTPPLIRFCTTGQRGGNGNGDDRREQQRERCAATARAADARSDAGLGGLLVWRGALPRALPGRPGLRRVARCVTYDRSNQGNNDVNAHAYISSTFPTADPTTGNNRGNRYSHKHLRLKPSDDEYWNFSIDELARWVVRWFGPRIRSMNQGKPTNNY